MIELRYDDLGLDELVGTGCTVHLERMDKTYFCLIVENDKRRVYLNISGRGKVTAGVYADEPAALAQQKEGE